jgi:hypothetical protein
MVILLVPTATVLGESEQSRHLYSFCNTRSLSDNQNGYGYSGYFSTSGFMFIGILSNFTKLQLNGGDLVASNYATPLAARGLLWD